MALTEKLRNRIPNPLAWYRDTKRRVSEFKSSSEFQNEALFATAFGISNYVFVPLQTILAQRAAEQLQVWQTSPEFLTSLVIASQLLAAPAVNFLVNYFMHQHKYASADTLTTALWRTGSTPARAALSGTIYDIFWGIAVNPSDWRAIASLLTVPFIGGDGYFFAANFIIKPFVFFPNLLVVNLAIAKGWNEPIIKKAINPLREKVIVPIWQKAEDGRVSTTNSIKAFAGNIAQKPFLQVDLLAARLAN